MSDAIHIRAARPEEFPACRMLLPPFAGMSPGTQYLLALQQQPPFIVGAIAFARGMHATHEIRLRVIRTHRRQRIGAALLASVEEVSREGGAAVLLAVVDSIRHPDAQAFFTAMGFHRTGRLTTVRANHDAATRILYPLADRLSHRLPAHQVIVPLSEAPRTAVTALYRAELARSPWTTPWALLDEISAPRFAQSPVLISNGEVAALLLFYAEGERGVIAARIVTPPFKGGPANVLLMAAGLRNGPELGVRHIEFDVPENNADTEKLARRLEAQVIQTNDQYLRKLGPR